jgi:hypothetical protein
MATGLEQRHAECPHAPSRQIGGGIKPDFELA